jgi:hypothetical protein
MSREISRRAFARPAREQVGARSGCRVRREGDGRWKSLLPRSVKRTRRSSGREETSCRCPSARPMLRAGRTHQSPPRRWRPARGPDSNSSSPSRARAARGPADHGGIEPTRVRRWTNFQYQSAHRDRIGWKLQRSASRPGDYSRPGRWWAHKRHGPSGPSRPRPPTSPAARIDLISSRLCRRGNESLSQKNRALNRCVEGAGFSKQECRMIALSIYLATATCCKHEANTRTTSVAQCGFSQGIPARSGGPG